MADHEHSVADSHSHGTAHHHTDTSGFTAAEVANFQADDYSAGKAVVLLMLGIFSTGVMIYSIVAYNVIS